MACFRPIFIAIDFKLFFIHFEAALESAGRGVDNENGESGGRRLGQEVVDEVAVARAVEGRDAVARRGEGGGGDGDGDAVRALGRVAVEQPGEAGGGGVLSGGCFL